MNHLYKKIDVFKAVAVGFNVIFYPHLNGKGSEC